MYSMPKRPPPAWLPRYAPVAEAIARLFHPYAEVAVHDLASDRIVALWNPFSGRKPGDPAQQLDKEDAAKATASQSKIATQCVDLAK